MIRVVSVRGIKWPLSLQRHLLVDSDTSWQFAELTPCVGPGNTGSGSCPGFVDIGINIYFEPGRAGPVYIRFVSSTLCPQTAWPVYVGALGHQKTHCWFLYNHFLLLFIITTSTNFAVSKCLLRSPSTWWYITWLRPKQSDHHTNVISFSWTKIFLFWLKFHWSLFPSVQIKIIHNWFRKWLDAEQATSHYLYQWWPSLLMHLCSHSALMCQHCGDWAICSKLGRTNLQMPFIHFD